MCSIDAGEPHSSALSPGDLVLIYVAAPAREFVGRAELASVVHDWTPSEAQVYPGDSPGGVLLTHVDEWDPPVPMDAVLSRIDSEYAKGDFETRVVRITDIEYDAALDAAAEHERSVARGRLEHDVEVLPDLDAPGRSRPA